jgi:hypothetical protein
MSIHYDPNEVDYDKPLGWPATIVVALLLGIVILIALITFE